MQRVWRTSIGCAVVLTLAWPRMAWGQTPAPLPADVATIDGIVGAYYDVINGPPGAKRQWHRDSTLYMPGAMFVAMQEANGRPAPARMTPEEFRQAVDSEFVALGFQETEIGRRVERFGNVALVRSVYETRRTAGGPLLGRGVNFLLLYWDGKRWWISSAVWDDERPGHTVPPSWIGKKEQTP
jgi:hypothetical protein